jgi:predicted metalloendopeptidase
MSPKIGYPDHWRDYGALKISRDDLRGNVVRATEFEYRRNLAKLGGPVDRGEWRMRPQTVNAYYNATSNEITFPAAILQPPFFDAAADDAANYGGIGAVIGHEMSHGFDDRGSQFIQRIKTDPHSPPAVRGTAPLRNQDGFYAAFGLRQGDKMYLPPEQRVNIW